MSRSHAGEGKEKIFSPRSTFPYQKGFLDDISEKLHLNDRVAEWLWRQA